MNEVNFQKALEAIVEALRNAHIGEDKIFRLISKAKDNYAKEQLLEKVRTRGYTSIEDLDLDGSLIGEMGFVLFFLLLSQAFAFLGLCWIIIIIVC